MPDLVLATAPPYAARVPMSPPLVLWCRVCGHSWERKTRRVGSLPKLCRKCKSPYWSGELERKRPPRHQGGRLPSPTVADISAGMLFCLVCDYRWRTTLSQAAPDVLIQPSAITGERLPKRCPACRSKYWQTDIPTHMLTRFLKAHPWAHPLTNPYVQRPSERTPATRRGGQTKKLYYAPPVVPLPKPKKYP